MKTVTIIGAGFSGLTLAYFLQKEGFRVRLHEKRTEIGGLLSTETETAGLVETAANALLSSKTVEEVFSDLEIEMAERQPARKKRFIFWEKPQRWPLSWSTTWTLAKSAALLKLSSESVLEPEKFESISDWGQRFARREFEERLLSPALLGIFAGDPSRLSASLIYRQFVKDRPPKGKIHGSVAPKKGMSQLIKSLAGHVNKQGGEILFKSAFQVQGSVTEPTVVATSAWSASDVLRLHPSGATAILEKCESLPLVSVTAFFAPRANDLQGFGCLFPVSQGFCSLGVVFNNCVFADRSSVRSETWIMGGVKDAGITAYGDEHLLENLLLDRKRLMGSIESPLSYKITRWHRAIPHYTTAWEKALQTLKVDPPLYLHGNYLGAIGLTRILERSKCLAKEIKAAHG